MELNFFKDAVFDLINESPTLNIADMAWNEKENLIVATMMDGSQFAVKIKPAAELTDREQDGLVKLGSFVDLSEAMKLVEEGTSVSDKVTPPPELDESIRRMIKDA